METFLGILIPFLCTTLGASIWSLLIPSIEQSEDMGKLSFLPAFIGF